MAVETKQWLRFRNNGATGFGTLTSSGISVHEGEMFGRNAATGKISGVVGGRAAGTLRAQQDRRALE